jgi:hypothetical protein
MNHNIGGWNKRPVPPGMKYCPTCKLERPEADFSGIKRKDGYCRSCKAARVQARRASLRMCTTISPATVARFWSRVNKDAPDGHWLWIGADRNRDGYGAFEVNGTSTQPHVVVFRLMGVEIPEGMVVDHICRVRKCCNPAHLRIVPPRVNAIENNLSPFAINARAQVCKYGHPFTPENTSRHFIKKRTTRHGRPGKPSYTRVCLVCKRERYHRTKGQQA